MLKIYKKTKFLDIFESQVKGEDKEQLISALNKSHSPVLIRSAFDLSQEQLDRVKKTVKENLGIEINARFETSPDLVSGIELTTDGEKVAWSIASYLTSLEKSIDEVLSKQSNDIVETNANEIKQEPKTNKS